MEVLQEVRLIGRSCSSVGNFLSACPTQVSPVWATGSGPVHRATQPTNCRPSNRPLSDASRVDQVLGGMSRLAKVNIKGLGPAVASTVHFMHLTLVPHFNTAIVNGVNAAFAAKRKLDSWDSQFTMRETILRANEEHRNLLSKDLGAFAWLLFDIDCGRIVLEGNVDAVPKDLQDKGAGAARKRHEDALADEREPLCTRRSSTCLSTSGAR